MLRAEKGFPIVGQDTDGTVTPHDLGMSWIVNETKGDFIGRRSLRRPDIVRPDRKHLVGLLPQDPDGAPARRRAAGAARHRHDPDADGGTRDVVAYRSAALGRTFALAMLERGVSSTAPPSMRRSSTARSQRRSRRRCSTTPKERAVTAEPTLAHRALDLAAIGAVEVPLLAQVDLRVRMEPGVGLPLPTAPNTRPVERWPLHPVARPRRMAGDERHRPGCHDRGGPPSIAGRTPSRRGRRQREPGPPWTSPVGAPDLLATGCSLDLHPRWHAGMCAQTLFARAPVILEQRSDATRVFVRASFADYLIDRLLVAATTPRLACSTEASSSAEACDTATAPWPRSG